MSVIPLSLNGTTYNLETARPLSGGVAGTALGNLFTDLVNATSPKFVTANVANGGTVALSNTGLNILRTTADGTIAGAILNLPASPTDGETVKFSTTGVITTVTGTVSFSNTVVPAIAATVAGGVVKLGYNAAAARWFHV